MKVEWILGLCALLSVPLAVFALLRRNLPWIWKLAAGSVTVFYVVWFRDEMGTLIALRAVPLRDTLPQLGQSLLHVSGLVLVILWPMALAGAVFGVARDQTARRLQRLVLLTALFWMALVVDVFAPPFARSWIGAAEDWVGAFLKAAAAPPTTKP